MQSNSLTDEEFDLYSLICANNGVSERWIDANYRFIDLERSRDILLEGGLIRRGEGKLYANDPVDIVNAKRSNANAN